MKPTIAIEYDGKYPNLCRGLLVVVVDGRRWQFPSYCLASGGNVAFDECWNEHVTQGPWSIREWPDGFPADLRGPVLQAVNQTVAWGCCGGCV